MSEKTNLNLYQKIAKITGEIDGVAKTGKNSVQNYAFIEQAMIVAILRTKLSENNLVIREQVTKWSVEWKEGYKDDYGKTKGRGTKALLDLTYIVTDGDDPTVSFSDPWVAEADDTSDKAINKALTAGEKTYLMKLFKISDKDDPDAHSPEAAPVRDINQNESPKEPSRQLTDEPISEMSKQKVRLRLGAKGYTGPKVTEFVEFIINKPAPTTEADAAELLSALETK